MILAYTNPLAHLMLERNAHNPFVLITTVMEILLLLIVLNLTIQIRKRYKERGSEVALELSRCLFFYALAPIQMLDTFLLDKITVESMGYIASFGYATAILFSSIANFFLIRFTYHLYSKPPFKAPNIIGGLDILMGILFFIFRVQNIELISIFFLLMHILFSTIIGLTLGIKSHKVAAKIENKLERWGFHLIGSFGWLIIITFILFLIESLVGFGNFTIYGSIAWVCGTFGAFNAYVGFTLPPWFRRLFGLEEGK